MRGSHRWGLWTALSLASWGVLAPTRPPLRQAQLSRSREEEGLGVGWADWGRGVPPGWDLLGHRVPDATGRGFCPPPRPTLRGWAPFPGTYMKHRVHSGQVSSCSPAWASGLRASPVLGGLWSRRRSLEVLSSASQPLEPWVPQGPPVQAPLVQPELRAGSGARGRHGCSIKHPG